VTLLLDSNVLIALVVPEHIHHEAAERWFPATGRDFATCPMTQGSLIRLLLREGQATGTALRALEELVSMAGHQFWPDELSYADVPMKGVVGHRQVTDAYLAALARRRQGRLATFDAGLAALHVDVAELVPVS
jgi:toxin-antitoxin system PIN domain toxin